MAIASTITVLLKLVGEAGGALAVMSKTSSALEDLGKKATIFGREMSQVGRALSYQVTVPILAIGGAAIASAAQFDQGMRKVSGISDFARQSLGNYQLMVDGVRETSVKFGLNSDQLAMSLYQIVSAGKDGADALKLLQVSAQAAVAGLTDPDTAIRAILGVINAYHLSADDATMVSDKLFRMVDKGIFTFPELANAMSSVLPTAAAAKVSLDELGAGMIVLTRASFSADEATTALNRMLRDFIKPSKEASEVAQQLNIDFSAQALTSKGLASVLTDIASKVGLYEVVGNSFAAQSKELSRNSQLTALNYSEKIHALEAERLGLPIIDASSTSIRDQTAAYNSQIGALRAEKSARDASINSQIRSIETAKTAPYVSKAQRDAYNQELAQLREMKGAYDDQVNAQIQGLSRSKQAMTDQNAVARAITAEQKAAVTDQKRDINQQIALLRNQAAQATDSYKRQKLALIDASLAGADYNLVMADMSRRTGLTIEQLAALFPDIRALRAALILTANGAEDFAGAMDEMKGSTGATQRVFEEMSKAFLFQFDRFKETLRVAAEELGDRFLPRMTELVQHFTDLVNEFRVLSPETQDWILKLAGIAAAIGPVLLFGGTLIRVLGLILETMSGIGAVTNLAALGLVKFANEGLIPLTLGLGAGLLALATFKTAWEENWGGIQQIVGAALQEIHDDLLGFLPPELKSIVETFFAGVFAGIPASARAQMGTVGDAFDELVAELSQRLQPFGDIFNGIRPKWTATLLLLKKTVVDDFLIPVWAYIEGDLIPKLQELATNFERAFPRVAVDLLNAALDILYKLLLNIDAVLTNRDWGRVLQVALTGGLILALFRLRAVLVTVGFALMGLGAAGALLPFGEVTMILGGLIGSMGKFEIGLYRLPAAVDAALNPVVNAFNLVRGVVLAVASGVVELTAGLGASIGSVLARLGALAGGLAPLFAPVRTLLLNLAGDLTYAFGLARFYGIGNAIRYFLTGLMTDLGGFVRALGTLLAPVLVPLRVTLSNLEALFAGVGRSVGYFFQIVSSHGIVRSLGLALQDLAGVLRFNGVAPALVGVARALADFFGQIARFGIVNVLRGIATGLLTAFGGGLISALTTAGQAIVAFILGINWPLVALVAAIAAVAYAFIFHFDEIKAALTSAYTSYIQPVLTELQAALGDVWKALQDGWSALQPAFAELGTAAGELGQAFGELWTVLEPLIGGLGGLIVKILAVGAGILIIGTIKGLTLAFTLLAKGIELVAPALVWLVERLADAVHMLAGFISGLSGFLKDLDLTPESLRKFGEGLVRGLAEGIAAGLQWVWNGLQRIADLFPHSPAKEGPLARPIDWGSLFTGLLGAIQAIPGQVAGLLSQFVTLGEQVVSDFIQGGAHNLPLLIPMWTNALRNLFLGLMSGDLPEIAGAATKIVGLFLTAIGSNLDLLLGRFQAALDGVIAWLDANAPGNLLGAAMRLTAGFLQGIQTGLTGLVDPWVNGLVELGLTLARWGPRFFQEGDTLVQQLLNGVTSVAGTIAVVFGNIWIDIYNEVRLWPANLFTWGQSAIQGLIDGLGSLKEGLAGALQTIADYFPHSPAEEGPLAEEIRWNVLYDQLEVSAAQLAQFRTGLNQIAGLLRSVMGAQIQYLFALQAQFMTAGVGTFDAYRRGLDQNRGALDQEFAQWALTGTRTLETATPAFADRGLRIVNAFADGIRASLTVVEASLRGISTLSDRLGLDWVAGMARFGADMIRSLAGSIPTAIAGVLTTALQDLADYFPSSPAKKGPLAKVVDWTYLWDGLSTIPATALAALETAAKELFRPLTTQFESYRNVEIPSWLTSAFNWGVDVVTRIADGMATKFPGLEEMVAKIKGLGPTPPAAAPGSAAEVFKLGDAFDALGRALSQVSLPDLSAFFASLKLPELPKLPEIKLPEFRLPEFKVPEIRIPEFKLPTITLPELPRFALPEIDVPDVSRLLKERIRLPDLPPISLPRIEWPRIELPSLALPPEVTTRFNELGGLFDTEITQRLGRIGEKAGLLASLVWSRIVADFHKNFLDPWARKIDEIKSNVERSWNELTTWLTTGWEENFVRPWQGMTAYFGTILGGVWEQVKLRFQTAWTEIVRGFEDWKTETGAKLQSIGDMIKLRFDAAWAEVTAAFDRWKADLGTRLQGVGDDFKSSVTDPITTRWNDFLAEINSWPQRLGDVLATLKTFWDVTIAVPVRTAWDAATAVVKAAVAEIQRRVTEFATNLSKEWEEKVATPLRNFGDLLRAGFDQVQLRLQAAWNTISAEVGSWPGRFFDWGTDLIESLIRGAGNALAGIERWLDENIAAWLPVHSPARKGPLAQTPDWGFLWEGLMGLPGQVLGWISQSVGTIGATLGENATNLVEWGKQLPANLLAGIRELMGDFQTPWNEAFADLWGRFGTWFIDIWNKGHDLIREFLKGIGITLPEVTVDTNKIWATMLTTITGWFGPITTQGAALVANLANGILSLVYTLGATISGGYYSLTGELSTWLNGMFNWGANIIQQLIDGIRSKLSEFLSALGEYRQYIPFSPAEAGPFSRQPNWGWIWEGLVPGEDRVAAVQGVLDRVRAAILTQVPGIGLGAAGGIPLPVALRPVGGTVAGGGQTIQIQIFVDHLDVTSPQSTERETRNLGYSLVNELKARGIAPVGT